MDIGCELAGDSPGIIGGAGIDNNDIVKMGGDGRQRAGKMPGFVLIIMQTEIIIFTRRKSLMMSRRPEETVDET